MVLLQLDQLEKQLKACDADICQHTKNLAACQKQRQDHRQLQARLFTAGARSCRPRTTFNVDQLQDDCRKSASAAAQEQAVIRAALERWAANVPLPKLACLAPGGDAAALQC